MFICGGWVVFANSVVCIGFILVFDLLYNMFSCVIGLVDSLFVVNFVLIFCFDLLRCFGNSCDNVCADVDGCLCFGMNVIGVYVYLLLAGGFSCDFGVMQCGYLCLFV